MRLRSNARPVESATETSVAQVMRIGSAELSGQVEALALELAAFKNLAMAFERWHQDMISLTTQSRQMRSKGDDIKEIVRQLIMVSLNAKIEAARAGEAAAASSSSPRRSGSSRRARNRPPRTSPG